jgi:flavin reductase (DIM6/NTAB) family NADH-FMN oxidoreductase RutF
MFYEPKHRDHGLPHDPYKACVVPRPIGWISTLSREGVPNLAPYSFYNAISGTPPMVMFSSIGHKDSQTNCEDTGEFVVNMATWALRHQVNETSFAFSPQVDEMAATGLEPAPSRIVKAPRVAASPIALECTYWKTVELPSHDENSRHGMVIGEVVGVHIAEDVLTGGLIDMAKLRPIARLGYMEYCVVDETFTMARPTIANE